MTSWQTWSLTVIKLVAGVALALWGHGQWDMIAGMLCGAGIYGAAKNGANGNGVANAGQH